MSKYIIEFRDKPSYQEDNIIFYPCKQIPWWSVSKSNIDKLTPLDKALEEAYQRGLDDAWETARKIALMDTETSENVTGYFGLFRIMENLTPMQAIEKLKAYEEKQKADDEIKVGDEVIDKDDDKTIVTNIHGELFDGLCHDGSTISDLFLEDVVKTDRHFDIDKILEEMRS